MGIEVMDVTQAIWNTAKKLENGVQDITDKAKLYAEAEKNYRVALARQIIELKTQKYPATLIGDIARGNVADLKFKRDVAEQIFKSARDGLQARSNELSAMQSILKVQTKIE